MQLTKLFFITLLLVIEIIPAFASEKIPLCAVDKGQNWIILDNKGDTLFTLSNSSKKEIVTVEGYSEGIFRVKVVKYGETTWRFYNLNGKLLFSNDSEEANDFVNGFAIVMDTENREQNTKRVGIIDKSGKYLIDKKLIDALNFSEGLAYIAYDNKRGYIDTKGEFKIVIKNNETGYNFSEGLAAVSDSKTYKVCYIDITGKVVIPYKDNEPSIFKEGLTAVTKSSKFGYMDKKGEVYFPIIYGEVTPFMDSLAFICDYEDDYKKKIWSIFKRNKEKLTEITFEDQRGVSEGLGLVKKNKKWSFINKKGEFEFSTSFINAEPFKNGLAFAVNDSKRGYIDKTGNFQFIFNKDEKLVDLRYNKLLK
jgi:hypothetical protein